MSLPRLLGLRRTTFHVPGLVVCLTVANMGIVNSPLDPPCVKDSHYLTLVAEKSETPWLAMLNLYGTFRAGSTPGDFKDAFMLVVRLGELCELAFATTTNLASGVAGR